jgi:arylsulfatase A-like enzyme
MYNGQTTTNYDKPAIKGYNESDLLLDPLTYQYYDFAATRNAGPVRNVSGEYSPDFTAKTAYEFLDLALGDDDNSARRPFFLTIAPIAPHCEGAGPTGKPPQAADRHKDLYKDYRIPRNTSNFNPNNPSGVSWVRDMEQMNDTVIDINDEYQRQRLRSLQSVDEMVEQVVLRLEEAGVLDNTHIFYTSDNGYHIGQHRLHPGKMLGFEEDIRVPLVWRGPGVQQGDTLRYATSHSDLAPTIMKIAGLSYDDREFDGAPLELEETTSRREHVGIEFWGTALAESTWSVGVGGYNGTYPENTYKGLRIEAEKYGLYYSVWCTQESELYDMKARSHFTHPDAPTR